MPHQSDAPPSALLLLFFLLMLLLLHPFVFPRLIANMRLFVEVTLAMRLFASLRPAWREKEFGGGGRRGGGGRVWGLEGGDVCV
jgi:hypothetical protein